MFLIDSKQKTTGFIPPEGNVADKTLFEELESNVNAPELVIVGESKTLSLSDIGTVQKVTAIATITIPLNESVAFPIGSEIVVLSYTASDVTIDITETGTLNSVSSYKKINGQYTTATLKKIATDEWVITGSLKA